MHDLPFAFIGMAVEARGSRGLLRRRSVEDVRSEEEERDKDEQFLFHDEQLYMKSALNSMGRT
jgi:hypothetical protein